MRVTRDMVLGACPYVGIAEKAAWTEALAEKLLARVEIAQGSQSFPPMFIRDPATEHRALASALLRLYLRQEYVADEAIPEIMCAEDYDAWHGGAMFGALEAYKRDPELRGKVYELLADFRDLRRMLEIRVKDMLAVMNDSVRRQSDMMTAQVEAFPALLGEIQKLSEQAAE